jgi:site-specific DNA recombinase
LKLTDIARSNKWKIVDVYKDEDRSGAGEERPEFERLLRDAKQGKFNIVLSKNQARFTRDMEVVERVLHGDFKKWGIRFVGAVDGTDTANKSGKKSRQIHGLVNEWYLESLSEDIRDTFQTKMKAGQFVGSFAPYGYKKDPENKHKLIEDKEAADVVRLIFKLYLEGYGTHIIAQKLIDKGIPKPTEYKKMQGSKLKIPKVSNYGLWGHTTINRILRNRVYIGTLEQGKETTVSYKDRTRIVKDKKDWVVVENCHKPIIKEADFRKVQEDLDSKRRVQKKKPQAHIFANKLRCKECGGSMLRTATNTRNGKGQDMQYAYFKCKNGHLAGNRICEYKNRISYTDLYGYVYAEFIDIITAYEENREAVELTNRTIKIVDYEEQQRELISALQVIQGKIKENNDFITKSYMDKVKGNISEEIFATVSQSFHQELDQLEKRKADIEETIEELKRQQQDKADIEKIAKKFLKKKKKELTRELVIELIDYIEIGAVKEDERVIDIYWKI